MTHRQFNQVGQLAIEPSALTLTFGAAASEPAPFTLDGDCAIVHVYGPLVSRVGQDPFFDSYEAIVARVQCALESSASTVIMCIDSPGGLVSGCMAASRAIRKAATVSGKRLIAYAGECATSAAYALACAAQTIVLPPTGRVGSIGVIEVLPSFARQQNALGIDVTVLTSGARKADGNPALLMTDDARSALQLGVDRMAEAFFELVAEMRPSKINDVASLEASVYYGSDAVKIGLADALQDFDQLRAALAAPQAEKDPQDMTRAEIVAGLKALAESDGADAEAAKRMLAAEEAPPAKDDEAPPSEEPAAAAPPADEDPEKEKEGYKAAAAAAMAPLGKTVAALQAKIDAFEKAQAASNRAARAELFATRPDVPKALIEALKGASLDECRAALAAIPLPNPAAAASVSGTRGEGQGDGTASRLPADQAHALKVAMGLVEPKVVSRMNGSRQEFGVYDYGTDPAAVAQLPGVPKAVAEKGV